MKETEKSLEEHKSDQKAINAGKQYIVSPDDDERVIEL